jgi:hypothetical protein
MSMKLYVGNLAFATSSQDLQELFAAAGTVESASVVEDRDTGRSRGFGFVEMSSKEEGEAGIARAAAVVVVLAAVAAVVAAAVVTVVIAAAAVAMAAAAVAVAIASPVGKHFLMPQLTPGRWRVVGHHWLLFANAHALTSNPSISPGHCPELEFTNAFGVITSAQGLRKKETSRSL